MKERLSEKLSSISKWPSYDFHSTTTHILAILSYKKVSGRVRRQPRLAIPILSLLLMAFVSSAGCGAGQSPPLRSDQSSGEQSSQYSGEQSSQYSEVQGDQPSGEEPPGDQAYGAGGAPPTVENIPKFPWPPPEASETVGIRQELLKPAGETIRLSDVEEKLSIALDSQGYAQKSYYSVPGGFAMVTRLEQFLLDGRSKEPPDRWASEIGPLREFSLDEYFKALFTANPGRYRIIVFIVTDNPFAQSGTTSQDEAESWLRSGLNELPESIGRDEYSEDYTTTVLVYEFEQPGRGEEVVLKIPGSLTAPEHLEGARIYNALEG